MTIEKFDREKAQRHLDSEGAVLVRDASGDKNHYFYSCWHLFEGKAQKFEWHEMRLCYLANTPPNHIVDTNKLVSDVAEQFPYKSKIVSFEASVDELKRQGFPVDEQPKAEPFRITGPGRYSLADGRKASVRYSVPYGCWVGEVDGDPATYHWESSGTKKRYYIRQYGPEWDLVARLPDEPEQTKADDLAELMSQISAKSERSKRELDLWARTAECIREQHDRLTALEQTVNGEK